ncbi:MAG: 3-phosphoglycerate dehydrogenase [Desulfurococcales archaeon]|nr:3-phosphoglycerate dehydrogenase [Desulfurococcales archaeon]
MREKGTRSLEGVRVLVVEPVDVKLKFLLEQEGALVDYRPGIGREELLDVVGDYEVLVVRGKTRVDRELASRARRLMVVARAGSGLDNIDVEYLSNRGIAVLNSPDAVAESVAELAIGLMIAASRSIVDASLKAKRGRWDKVVGRELYGKELAIVGFGRIGRRVAEIAVKAFSMKVRAFDIADLREHARRIGVDLVETLDEALEGAEYLSIHVPLTPSTYKMIGWRELRMLRPGAILVNTARGGVVDEEALLKALDEGLLGAAALDVLSEEPPRSAAAKKLLEHPRVIVTPHIGSSTREAQERAAIELAQRIKEVIAEARRGAPWVEG